MERITVLSIFPKMISDALSYGIVKRANDKVCIDSIDLRNWGINKYKKVDDQSVAPGPGMLFRADVVANAISDLKEQNENSFVIHMSPRGIPLTKNLVKELSLKKHLIILASRYEGLDQRAIDNYIDVEVSIGDYVLSGGELPCLVLVDAVLRFSGNILSQQAVDNESFHEGLLEYHHYTKPLEFEKCTIPEYLRSGNHKLIKEKRFIEQLYVTWLRRPDLFREYPLCNVSVQNNNLLVKIKKENKLLQNILKNFEKVVLENKNV